MVKPFSGIAPAGRVSNSSDRLIGIDSGNNDLLFIGGNRATLSADRTYYAGFFFGTLVGGSGYVNGTYNDVTLTGGSGSGAKANITVSGGAVVLVQWTTQGTGTYQIADVLTTANTNLGGSGSGFTYTLTGVGNDSTTDGTTVATAYKHPQTAFIFIRRLDFARNEVTVQIGDGVYNHLGTLDGTIDVKAGWEGGGALYFVGNSSFPQAVMFDHSFSGGGDAGVYVDSPLTGEIWFRYINVYSRSSFTSFKFLNTGGYLAVLHNCSSGGEGLGPDACIYNTFRAPVLVAGTFYLTTTCVTLVQFGAIEFNFCTVNALVPITNANPLVSGQNGGHGFFNGVTWAGSYAGRGYCVGLKDTDVYSSINDQIYGTGDSFIPEMGNPQVVGAGVYYRTQFSSGTLIYQAAVQGQLTPCDDYLDYQQPTDGFSFTLDNMRGNVLFEPAGTLPSGNITMPPYPANGQLINMWFTQAITTLTFSPNTGQSLIGNPSSVAAGGKISAIYRQTNTKWYFGR